MPSKGDTKYPHAEIYEHRLAGLSWDELAHMYDAPSSNVLRSAHYRWCSKQQRDVPSPDGETPPPDGDVTATVGRADIARITSLDDLLAFFKVNQDDWDVERFLVNKWETAAYNHEVAEWDINPLYQVKANLVRSRERWEEIMAQVRHDYLADIARHAPVYEPIERATNLGGEEAVLFELAVHDPHIGMLAWGEEVGESYDVKIAVQDYAKAVSHLLGLAHLYNTERILYVVGHDFLHVDSYASSPKGSSRGGMTAGGTMQDVDTRLAKMFTIARRAAVAGIDLARTVAPVDVVVVPGNHDPQQMYRMGEVLNAWYRHDPEVNVLYGADKRRWYRYGRTGFLLTHGEEYKRQRDNLAMIFATEAPKELLTKADYWEVHTGHNHIALAGGVRYDPKRDLTETRSIRVRSLPGITPEDAWHHESGYKHRRAATVLCWYKSGGMAGHHEFTL